MYSYTTNPPSVYATERQMLNKKGAVTQTANATTTPATTHARRFVFTARLLLWIRDHESAYRHEEGPTNRLSPKFHCFLSLVDDW